MHCLCVWVGVQKRLATGGVAVRRVASSASAAPSAASTEAHPSVTAYDEWLKTRIEPFEQAGAKIGGAVGTQTAAFGKLFRVIRDILAVVPLAKKPADSELATFFAPVVEAAQPFQEEPDKRNADFNILNAIKEAAGAAYWISIEKTPQAHVAEAADPAVFWGNKARAQFKESYVTDDVAAVTECECERGPRVRC